MTKLMQRTLIAGWIVLALFLMSSLANAQVMPISPEGPVIITQQGAFTILQGPTKTVVCTRMGNVVQCQ